MDSCAPPDCQDPTRTTAERENTLASSRSVAEYHPNASSTWVLINVPGTAETCPLTVLITSRRVAAGAPDGLVAATSCAASSRPVASNVALITQVRRVCGTAVTVPAGRFSTLSAHRAGHPCQAI